MRSPFPGMDLYIEESGLWEDFHQDLMRDIDYRRSLNPPLSTAETAWLEKRLRT